MRKGLLLFWAFSCLDCLAQPFRLPTANDALFKTGAGERFLVGTVGKPWMTGAFGCVRTEGWQMHEGLDIRCLQRDKSGEPTDPVMASADGAVAYVNNRSALSNYGRYIILRHEIEGLEVFTLYAHLREIRPGLALGQPVKAGEQIGVMGRSSNTGQGISRDRAHVHFEVDFMLNPRFAAWFRSAHKGERNDHGDWNGRNLIAIDPAALLVAQKHRGAKFSLVGHLKEQTELCRIMVRAPNLGWAKRFPALVQASPASAKEGIVAYEISLNFNGLPYQLIARAASEVKNKSKYQLLAVNEAEYKRNPCRRLITRKGTRFDIGPKGMELLALLAY